VLFKNIARKIENVDFLKAFIFAPKPDDFLMNDERLSKHYKWISGLKNTRYIDVVESSYYARPTDPTVEMDISDRSTYYKVEKGTDINLAIHILSKAYYNSFDIAYIVSGDTDYIPIFKQLKNIGKIAVLVTVQGQNFGKIIPEIDDFIVLDRAFFNTCRRD
jgi:uncharacterized LabA/DUF88 family protein